MHFGPCCIVWTRLLRNFIYKSGSFSFYFTLELIEVITKQVLIKQSIIFNDNLLLASRTSIYGINRTFSMMDYQNSASPNHTRDEKCLLRTVSCDIFFAHYRTTEVYLVSTLNFENLQNISFRTCKIIYNCTKNKVQNGFSKTFIVIVQIFS